MIKILKKIDKPLFFITIFMFIFGLLMIFSASYVKAITALDNAYYYLIRQGMILVICLFVFLFLININTEKYRKTYMLILYLSIGLLFLLYPFGIWIFCFSTSPDDVTINKTASLSSKGTISSFNTFALSEDVPIIAE